MFVEYAENNKYSVSVAGIYWQYEGPATNITTRPEKVYKAMLRDIDDLFDDIAKGDKTALNFFGSPPGDRRVWSMFLMKLGKDPLSTRSNDEGNYNNMTYKTPEERQFLIQQLKKPLGEMFSRYPHKPADFKEFIPKTFMNEYGIKYDVLRNVNKNQNLLGRAMTIEQMREDATKDIEKLKAYITKAFEKMTPVIPGEYGQYGLEWDKNQVIKKIPKANVLAGKRFKKATMINSIGKQNPIARGVSKMIIKKSPGGAENGAVNRLVKTEVLVKRDKSLGGNGKLGDGYW